MKKLFPILLSSLALLFVLAMPVSAHRSGCHSWHSCPSDSGSYTCGDTGHCSACSDNQYCQNGNYSPVAARVEPAPPVQAPIVIPAPTSVPLAAPISTPQPVSGAIPAPFTQVVSPPILVPAKPVAKPPSYFVGVPRTYAQLFSCRIVGNGTSKIYHLQNSRLIKTMNLKNKTCFTTEATAKGKGYRKSKT